jgi:glycosyltransferase involved in cell wall biosynthesis
MSVQASPRPRALLVCDYFIRYQTGLAEGLRANGWEPVMVGRRHDAAFGSEPGAMRRYMDDHLGPEQRFLEIEGRVRDPRGWLSLGRRRREVHQLKPRVTHIQPCVDNDPRLLLAADLRPYAYAITIHDLQAHPGDPISRHHALFVKQVQRWAGLVFVHADRLRDQLLEQALTRAPIVVVPHGVDRGDSQPLPQIPSILFFGRIREYKGLTVLLDALERLWRPRPDVTLTIAGEGTLPEHPALRDPRVVVHRRHIAERELAGLFGSASIVALPYVEASQSGVGSLAKAHGRPLIATDVGGLPELVSDDSGVLVPAGDADALARALDEVLGDRIRLEQMRGAALRTMEDGAGWPMVAERTIEAYERYLGPGAVARRRRAG